MSAFANVRFGIINEPNTPLPQPPPPLITMPSHQPPATNVTSPWSPVASTTHNIKRMLPTPRHQRKEPRKVRGDTTTHRLTVTTYHVITIWRFRPHVSKQPHHGFNSPLALTARFPGAMLLPPTWQTTGQRQAMQSSLDTLLWTCILKQRRVRCFVKLQCTL